jgi:hypothetical protein
MLDDDTKGPIQILIYPVQFEKDPKDGIKRVVEFVIQEETAGMSPEKYIAAIKSALISTEDLSTLIPQPHSDSTIRDYLRDLERALADNPDYRQ